MKLSPRERFLRALKKQEVDRLPFWVKVFGDSYKMLQPEPYKSMDGLHLAEFLVLEHFAYANSPVAEENDNYTLEVIKNNGNITRIYHTKEGDLKEIEGFDKSSYSYHLPRISDKR